MADAWTSPAVVVAGVAAVASIVSAGIAYAVWRQQLRAADPEVSCLLRWSLTFDGWLELILGAENRSGEAWSFSHIAMGDKWIRGVSEENILDVDNAGRTAPSRTHLQPRAKSLHIPLAKSIPTAGSVEGGIGRIGETVFLQISPAHPAQTVKFKLVLRSLGPKQRERRFSMQRDLPMPLPR